MKKHQIHIFATKADLEALLGAIESKRKLQYVKGGLFDVSVFDHLSSLLNYANLGVALKGDNVQETRYLVADRDVLIEVRTVPQHNGGVKYAIDQKANPKTIVFQPGGVFGEMCVIIAGNVGTISEDESSISIFKLFSKEIKQQFKHIQSFWVGAEAEKFLDKGWQLTTGVTTPTLYDLKRNR